MVSYSRINRITPNLDSLIPARRRAGHSLP